MFSSKLSLALLPALVLTGCANLPTESATPTPATFTACLVASSSGLTDGGVNESAYSAIKEAVVSLGVSKLQTVLHEKSGPNSIYKAVNQMVRKGCNVVVATGDRVRGAMVKVARANPDIAFVLVDDAVPSDVAHPLANNLKHLTFDAGQSAILAGYLAAANSKTGLVATFGSFDTPAVRASMQGFSDGVQLYNNDADSDVVVLGAPGIVSEWKFLGSSTDKRAAKAAAAAFLADGADVIYPVAGAAGAGAGLATVGKTDALVIGCDRDWFMDADNVAWRTHVLASTVKQVSRPVLEVIKAYVAKQTVGDPATNEYVGTLANAGVSLTAERDVPYAALFNSSRSKLISGINSGEIPTPKGATK
ncbi:MAG: BMP family ABC transporter substrate-binding protein [Rhodoluna sp.]|nr:BMP family ABC transporter substrate-binding protein [Rhodoluna sp.]